MQLPYLCLVFLVAEVICDIGQSCQLKDDRRGESINHNGYCRPKAECLQSGLAAILKNSEGVSPCGDDESIQCCVDISCGGLNRANKCRNVLDNPTDNPCAGGEFKPGVRNHAYCPFSSSNVQCCIEKKTHWEIKRDFGDDTSSSSSLLSTLREYRDSRNASPSFGSATLPDFNSVASSSFDSGASSSFNTGASSFNPGSSIFNSNNAIFRPVVSPIIKTVSTNPYSTPGTGSTNSAFAPINPNPAGSPLSISGTNPNSLEVGYAPSTGISGSSSLSPVSGFNNGNGALNSFQANAQHTANPSWYTPGPRININPIAAFQSVTTGRFDPILRSGLSFKVPLKRSLDIIRNLFRRSTEKKEELGYISIF